MKVFLGGTVNGSSWREYVIPKLKIDYFDPIVKDWNEAALERELYERRHCNYCLYVITPKLDGFYGLAEVTDDSFKRPDRTIYCFLKEDGPDEFNEAQLKALQAIGKRVEKNGGIWLKSLDEVIDFLNTGKQKETPSEAFSDEPFLDAFICFGRKHSKAMATQLADNLTSTGLKIWHDSNDLPLEIRYLSEVNAMIEKADNFIYVISPHAVRSEYCQRELEYAISLHKRILPIVHIHPEEDWNNLPEEIKKLNFLYVKKAFKGIEELIRDIREVMTRQKEYVRKHTDLLLKSFAWKNGSKEQKHLLFGRDRQEAIKWLKIKFENATPPCIPLPVQEEYILESEKLQLPKLLAFWLNRRTAFITDYKYFDSIIGVISLANPLSLLPQLYVLILATQVTGISVGMWCIFVFTQLAFALFGIKQKNLGMFLSMFCSMLISLTIIFIVLSRNH